MKASGTTNPSKVRTALFFCFLHSDFIYLKEVIIREAHLAFAYNLLFFKDVSLPNQTTQTKETKESKVVFDASQEPQEQTYPLSSVVAVAMALGLAHFALVVGGFTGSKGTDKLEALMLWLRRVMGHL